MGPFELGNLENSTHFQRELYVKTHKIMLWGYFSWNKIGILKAEGENICELY